MRQLVSVFAVLYFCTACIYGQVDESVSLPLQKQYDLSTDGRVFLLNEAARSSFFMLGELHGENEIPALIRDLWPSMWQAGYRRVAAEISPWAANQLEFGNRQVAGLGLWRQSEATFVTSLKRGSFAVLWGCDIEEVRPHILVRDLAAANPGNKNLQLAVAMIKDGYKRQMAPALLQLMQTTGVVNDRYIGGVSLQESLIRTFEVESDRFRGSALSASERREAVMKSLFYRYWVRAGKSKVFLRFGRNHLHRGLDRRGVSTLGNFIAELGAVERLGVFNVGAFAGGGKILGGGKVNDFDERVDDPAFAYLASIARFPVTVFDLRSLRQPLHRLQEGKRSAIETSLIYWADSYDAIIFYREVTPLGSSGSMPPR